MTRWYYNISQRDHADHTKGVWNRYWHFSCKLFHPLVASHHSHPPTISKKTIGPVCAIKIPKMCVLIRIQQILVEFNTWTCFEGANNHWVYIYNWHACIIISKIAQAHGLLCHIEVGACMGRFGRYKMYFSTNQPYLVDKFSTHWRPIFILKPAVLLVFLAVSIRGLSRLGKKKFTIQANNETSNIKSVIANIDHIIVHTKFQ